ncbi:hypothetical protein ADUPG1_007124, partial [Aduncisulcus paluster]
MNDPIIDYGCHDFTDCSSCIAANSYSVVGCGWCNDEGIQKCLYANELDPDHGLDDPTVAQCDHWEAHSIFSGGSDCCITLDNCVDCVRSSWCGWCNDEGIQKCLYANELDPDHGLDDPTVAQCDHWEAHSIFSGGSDCCITLDNCVDCVRSSWCGWCIEDEGRCYDTLEHTTTEVCDSITETSSCCSENSTCEDCKGNPSCTWCVDEDGGQNCIKHDSCESPSTARSYCCKNFDD